MNHLGLSLGKYTEFQDKVEIHQNSLILSLIKQHKGEGSDGEIWCLLLEEEEEMGTRSLMLNNVAILFQKEYGYAA